MSLKAILFDLDGTIIDSSGKPVDGIRDAIATLRTLGLCVVVTTNHRAGRATSILKKAKITVDVISDPAFAGAKKPSPRMVLASAEALGLRREELIYVGDSDTTDALAAVNARVLYLSARWSDPKLAYGLPVQSPDAVVRFVRRFMMEAPTWYWRYDGLDRNKNGVHVRALLPSTRASANLKEVLKFGLDPKVEGIGHRGFLFRWFLTSLYLDGTAGEIDTWTWYPSASGTPKFQKFHEFFAQASKCFRGNHIEDLLVRHKPAVKSAYARSRGEDPGFVNQTNTVHVNPSRKKHVSGKRILVIDDFCTAGYSFECARNLLLAAGADRVDCVSFGRYHDEYHVKSLKAGVIFNPWAPATLKDSDFLTTVVLGTKHAAALSEMERRLRA